jgi:hypothetical protein
MLARKRNPDSFEGLKLHEDTLSDLSQPWMSRDVFKDLQELIEGLLDAFHRN